MYVNEITNGYINEKNIHIVSPALCDNGFAGSKRKNNHR
jgi:hypothetical protein